MRLQPLIQAPRNKTERKEAAKRLAAARDHYVEVQRLGVIIHELDGIIQRCCDGGGETPPTGKLSDVRAYCLRLQLEFARDLSGAGVPMEGVIWKEREAA